MPSTTRRGGRSVSFELLRLDDDPDEAGTGDVVAGQQDPADKRRKKRKRRKNRKGNEVLVRSLSLEAAGCPSPDLDAVPNCAESSTGSPNADACSSSSGSSSWMVHSNGSLHPSDVSTLTQASLDARGSEVSCSSSTNNDGGGQTTENKVSDDQVVDGKVVESLDLSSSPRPEAAPAKLLPAEQRSSIPPSVHCSPILRQRTISSVEKNVEAEKLFGRSNSRKLETDVAVAPVPLPPPAPPPFDLNVADKMDWKQVMKESAAYPEEVESSPFQYMLDELGGGASLEMTTRAGDEQSRERVYNVLFHVPWRCEMLIGVGFFVCLDSFLSLLTVMPLRLCISIWKCLSQLRGLRAEDLCDLGCMIILVAGVLVLQQADISFIYHSIRFEPNIKLYMIYNMLEVFDKLFQSFGVDVLEVVFNSAVAYANCASEKGLYFVRLCFDQAIAVICFILHSFIILSEAITISAALHHAATNKSLLVLLMSNNFAEIKSNVFKRFSKDNMHNMAHNDTVERFHILTYLFFVFVQNIMIVEGPWMAAFLHNAALVMLSEAFVDLLKHSFLSKSNQINPAAYSEFLKTLCEQVMCSRRRLSKKSLHFVPIGPACVVIRVLIPLYGAYVTSASWWRNWLWSGVLAAGTFTFLAASKIVVGFSLRSYASWYLKRCRDKEQHYHAD